MLCNKNLQKALDVVKINSYTSEQLKIIIKYIIELAIADRNFYIYIYIVIFSCKCDCEEYCSNIIEQYLNNILTTGFFDFYTKNIDKLIQSENYRFHSQIFLTSIRGLGILNHENEYISGEYNFIKGYISEIEHPTIFDVGAHIGTYSTMVKTIKNNAQIHAFEPHPKTFLKLKQVAKKNLFFAYNLGMSDHNGHCTLFDRMDTENGSSHASIYQDVIENIHKTVSVQFDINLVTLDTFLENVPEVGIIHLLKIDTEGHELAVIRGSRKSIESGIIRAIQFEFNEMNVSSRSFLRDYYEELPGYDFYRMLPDGLVALDNYRSPLMKEIFAFQNIVAMKRNSEES
jgi:FkbM family methyltransferase